MKALVIILLAVFTASCAKPVNTWKDLSEQVGRVID